MFNFSRLFLIALTVCSINILSAQTSIEKQTNIEKLGNELAKLSLAERNEMLVQNHKLIWQLPHPPEFIQNHIFQEIYKQRQTVAPHFPIRSDSVEKDKINLQNWLNDYPDELAAYLTFLSDIITLHQTINQH